MANRSYLYSSNLKPGEQKNRDDWVITGIAEFAYDIPLIFKILLSQNTEATPSIIWERVDKIGLCASYKDGVRALKQYLGSLSDPAAEKLINEALCFLSDPSNENDYFILEAGEIYDCHGENYEEQNIEALNIIQNSLDREIENSLNILNKKPEGFIKKLFGKKEQKKADPLSQYYDIGLGCWSNILYYDFREISA